jgi:LPXTG-motif cell wall-anchored protein
VAIGLSVSVGLAYSLGSVSPAIAGHDVMMIDIVTLTGKKITVVASSDDSIDHVKAMIQNAEGISPDQQQLIFSGRVLRDGKTLAFYGIANGATLHLIVKLRGPPKHELAATGQSEVQSGILFGGLVLLAGIGAKLKARRRVVR